MIWAPDRRVRHKLIGVPKEWELAQLANPPHILILVGPFGAGKTSYTSELIEMNQYVKPPKFRTVDAQPLEKRNNMPLRQVTFREWQCILPEEGALYETTIVGLNPPYVEWEYWSDCLKEVGIKVKSPSAEEMAYHLPHFVSTHRICDLATTFKSARKQGQTVVFELSAAHTEDWTQFLTSFSGDKLFDKLVVVRLNADPVTRARRLLRRWKLNPFADPMKIVCNARILEGASMPTDIVLPCEIHDLDTEHCESMVHNLETIMRLCRINSRGG